MHVHPAFKTIITQCFVFLMLCVGGISFAEADDGDFTNIFLDVRCHYYADLAQLDGAATALWLRNSDTFESVSPALTQYDIAIIVTQQYDRALSSTLDYATEYKVSEVEAATHHYMEYCNK